MFHLTDRQLLEEILVKLTNMHNDIEKLNYKLLRIEGKLSENKNKDVTLHLSALSTDEKKELERLRSEKIRNDDIAYWENVNRWADIE